MVIKSTTHEVFNQPPPRLGVNEYDDVLRAVDREPQSVEAFDREISAALGAYPAFDTHVANTRDLVRRVQADGVAAQGLARQITESLALALQASVVIQAAPGEVADAFVGSRLGDGGRHEYGSFGTQFDVAPIAARA
jgi:putative acyl-CoA dehydrogenase